MSHVASASIPRPARPRAMGVRPRASAGAMPGAMCPPPGRGVPRTSGPCPECPERASPARPQVAAAVASALVGVLVAAPLAMVLAVLLAVALAPWPGGRTAPAPPASEVGSALEVPGTAPRPAAA
jgi:hypothetical protein